MNRRCDCCGVSVLGGSFQQVPVVSELEPVVSKEVLPGQLHPIGGDPRVWTPKVIGGRMKKEEFVLKTLRQFGYDIE